MIRNKPTTNRKKLVKEDINRTLALIHFFQSTLAKKEKILSDLDKNIEKAKKEKERWERIINSAPDRIKVLQKNGAKLKQKLRDMNIITGGPRIAKNLDPKDVAKAKFKDLARKLKELQAMHPDLELEEISEEK